MSYFNDWAVRFIYDEAADPLAAMLAKPFGEADQDINGYTLVGSQRKVRKVVTIDQSVRTAYIKARLKERATAKRNEFGCQPNYTETDEF